MHMQQSLLVACDGTRSKLPRAPMMAPVNGAGGGDDVAVWPKRAFRLKRASFRPKMAEFLLEIRRIEQKAENQKKFRSMWAVCCSS